jgi:hypothetical protein
MEEGPDNRSDLYRNKQPINKEDSMNEQHNIEESLWDYIDGLSSPEDKSTIQQLIASNKEWQTKYRDLLEAHQLLKAPELDAPSMRFTKNVMDEIARHHVAPATSSYINKNIIRGIGAFFGLMVVGFVIYMFKQTHLSPYHSTIPTDIPVLSQYGKDLGNNIDRLNLTRIFNNAYINIFILINMILGFMLLDMYLHRRKEAGHHKEA